MTEIEPGLVRARDNSFFFSIYGFFLLSGLLLITWKYHLTEMVVLSAACTAVWAASYLWAARSLDGVFMIERLSRSHIFPGEQVTVELSVSNRKYWPLAWILVNKPALQQLDVSMSPYDSPDSGNHCLRLGWLNWFQEAAWEYRVSPRRRGIFRLGPVSLTSGDPFAFFHISRINTDVPELIVYPPLLDPGTLVSSWPNPLGEKQARDFLYTDPLAVSGVRDYLPGDPLRRINWIATSRAQSLQSNLLDGSVAPRAVIVLGSLRPGPFLWHGCEGELAFELLVAAAANIALDLIRQRVEVGLLHTYAVEKKGVVSPYLPPFSASNQEQLREYLTRLALLTNHSEYDLEEHLERTPLPARTLLLLLTPSCDRDELQEWQILARGCKLACYILDSDSADQLPGACRLFPGWQGNGELARKVMGAGEEDPPDAYPA